MLSTCTLFKDPTLSPSFKSPTPSPSSISRGYPTNCKEQRLICTRRVLFVVSNISFMFVLRPENFSAYTNTNDWLTEQGAYQWCEYSISFYTYILTIYQYITLFLLPFQSKSANKFSYFGDTDKEPNASTYLETIQ